MNDIEPLAADVIEQAPTGEVEVRRRGGEERPPDDPPTPEPDESPGCADGALTGVHGSTAATLLEEQIGAGFRELHTALNHLLATDRRKDEQIARLHEELQAYRNDLLARMTRPLLLGLIRLHDDLGKVVDALHQRPAEELNAHRFFRVLDGFADDIELLLGQHGVEPFAAPGESFDPRRQTALRTVPAPSTQSVGAIAERLRPGFELGEALLLKERVAVYAVPTTSQQPAPEPAATTEPRAAEPRATECDTHGGEE